MPGDYSRPFATPADGIPLLNETGAAVAELVDEAARMTSELHTLRQEKAFLVRAHLDATRKGAADERAAVIAWIRRWFEGHPSPDMRAVALWVATQIELGVHVVPGEGKP